MMTANKEQLLQIRLIGILGLTLVMGALITSLTMFVFHRLINEAAQVRQNANELDQAWHLSNLASRMERSQVSYLLMGDQRYLRDNERYRANFAEILVMWDFSSLAPELQTLLYELERELLAYDDVVLQVAQAGERGDWEQAREKAASLNVHLSNLQRGSTLLVQTLQPEFENRLKQLNGLVWGIGLAGLVVFVAFSGLIVVTGGLVDRRLTRPIQRLAHAAGQVPAGAFSAQDVQPLMGFGDQLSDLSAALVQVVERHETRKSELDREIEALQEQLARLELT
jgi:methyl-accepting chemotaxis protein